MHEHLICAFDRSWRGLVHALQDVDVLAAEMGHFRSAGGTTLVDATPEGLGRDVRALLRISEASGVHVIAGTGAYREPYYPAHVYRLTARQLADVFVRELRGGIDGTAVRAGIIGEVGTWRHGITPVEERVLRAAAIASAETGAAVTTHTWFGELALDQVDLLTSEGCAPDRIVIGHFGDRRDLDAQLRVLERGVTVQYDHIGLEDVQSDAVRAELVAELVRRGYAAQLLLSCDVSFTTRLRAFGGAGYGVLFARFVPLLETAGVSRAARDMILRDNPRRLLAFETTA